VAPVGVGGATGCWRRRQVFAAPPIVGGAVRCLRRMGGGGGAGLCWWRRQVLVEPSGVGGGGGRQWRRSVLATSVSVGGCWRCRWVLAKGEGGCCARWYWPRQLVLVVSVGVGGGGGRRWRQSVLAAPPVVGGAGGRRWRRRKCQQGGRERCLWGWVGECATVYQPFGFSIPSLRVSLLSYRPTPRKTKHVYQGAQKNKICVPRR